MLQRRKVLLGLTAGMMLSVAPIAFAQDELLLRDILHGVSDAVVRDYIRDHYHEGRWDGHYWRHDGHRFTPREYRDYLCDRYDRKYRKHHKKWRKHHDR